MACCSTHDAGLGEAEVGDCGTVMENLYWKHFVPLHFCQILLPGSDFHSQLEIPKKFAKNARVLLHPEVTLRGPSGASWRAIMTVADNRVFFSDGWEEFVRDCSLQVGNILIFKYDRVSVFDVLIFEGDSLCEKEAAYFVRKRENEIRILREAKKAKKEVCKPKASKRSKFSHLYFNHRRKKRVHSKSVSSKANMRQSIRLATSLNTGDPHVNLAEQGKSPVLDAPANHELYTSEIETVPSNGCNNVHRTLPNEPHPDVLKNTSPFAEEPQVAEKDGSPEINAEPPNGNNFHLTFASEPLKDVPDVNGGWLSEYDAPEEDTPQYNRSINVEEVLPPVGEKTDGGSCIESTYSETRLKRQQPASKGNPWGTSNRSNQNFLSESGNGAVGMARSQLTWSSFIAEMTTTAIQHFQVGIPAEWYRKHLSLKMKDAILQIGDKTWLTRLSHQTSRSTGSINTGWKQFALENRLEVHDVCLFNLASREADTVTLDVSIFRATPTSETDEVSLTL